MYIVGIRHPGKSWRIVYRGYSYRYALRVCRKWNKLGYTTNLEEIQQEEE